MTKIHRSLYLQIALSLLFLTQHLNAAAFPVPEVYQELTSEVSDIKFGILETPKVVQGQFRKELSSERQVILFVSHQSLVIPCSLNQLLLVLLLFILFLVPISIFGRARPNNAFVR